MSKPNEEIEVKDQRKKSFFIADNRMIDEAAPVIGVYGGAVYSSLLRHADKDRRTWPSVTLIAKEWGVGRALVIRTLKKLESLCMISVERQKGQHNIYRICDQDEWQLKGHTSSPQIPVRKGTSSPQIPVKEKITSFQPVKEKTSSPQIPVCKGTSSAEIPVAGDTSSPQIPPLVSQENSKYNPITIPKKNLLSRMLFEEIIKANPHSRLCVLTSKQKEARIASWAEDIEKLNRIDRQNYDVIEKVIRAALKDTFWSKNILSGDALRRNWDRLTQEFVKDKKLTNGGSKAKYYSQGKKREWFLNGKLIPADQVPEDIRRKAEGPPPPASGPVTQIIQGLAGQFQMHTKETRVAR